MSSPRPPAHLQTEAAAAQQRALETYQSLNVRTRLRHGLPPSASAREEAAMLVAQDDLPAAARVLVTAIERHPVPAPDTVWWSLLDVNRMMNQRGAHDNAAALYAKQTGRSPPPWIPFGAESSAMPGLIVEGPVDEVTPDRERMLVQSIQAAGSGRLDVSRARVRPGGQGDDDARRLAGLLRRLRRTGVPVLLMGEHQLRDDARARARGNPNDDAPEWWDVVFEIAQWRGAAAEHAALSAEYLLRFHRSPPEYTSASVVMPPPIPEMPKGIWDEASIEAWWAGVETSVAVAEDRLVVEAGAWRRMSYEAAAALAAKVHATQGAERIVVRDLAEPLVALLEMAGAAPPLVVSRRRR